MSFRFFAPDAASGRVVSLQEDEAQHLTRVLRLKPGAHVFVFDGRGLEFDAVVESATRSDVRLEVREPRPAALREPSVAVTLAQAVLKGDKMDDVVRDAVMMGVIAVQPVITSRSETTIAAVERGRRQERWQRVALASAKQCGRAVLPRILEPATFGEIVTPGSVGTALMFVEPSAGAAAVPLTSLELPPPAEVALFVGPEGGWTPAELEAGGAVAHLVSLGPRTLRADAVATVAVAALFTLWKEL